jgi:phage baseplate assembly protein W
VVDFRAISYQGLTFPTSYRQSADAEFLDIRGTGFEDVANVVINGYRSPNFIVESSRRIFAGVPSAVRGEPVSDIQVLLLAAAAGQESAVVLDVGGGNGYVSGTAKLLQTVIKVLLTTPGSDIFNPQLGGGLRSVIGTNFNDATSAEMRVRQAISDTENQLQVLHSGTTNLPISEKLRSISVLSVEFSIESSALYARIAVTSQDGNRVSSGVTL